MPGTRKLGRTTAQRTAMLRAMVTFLLENGKIETTNTRAKEVQAMAEKMITTAKTNNDMNNLFPISFATGLLFFSFIENTSYGYYFQRGRGYSIIYRFQPLYSTILKYLYIFCHPVP